MVKNIRRKPTMPIFWIRRCLLPSANSETEKEIIEKSKINGISCGLSQCLDISVPAYKNSVQTANALSSYLSQYFIARYEFLRKFAII